MQSTPTGPIDTAFYSAQGYWHVKPTRSGFLDDVDRAAEALERVMRGPIGDRIAQAFGNDKGEYRQLRYLHYEDGAFRRLMQSAEIEAIARSVYGAQRAFITHSKVSRKEAGQNLPWHPHQDGAYKLHHGLSARNGMTIAIFLESADERNGTIQVFPGSHKLGTLPHCVEDRRNADGSRQLFIKELPRIEPRPVIAEKGDILVLDFDVIHQSAPNRSHGNRLLLLVEIKPHQGYPLDELGGRPIIVNGQLRAHERLIYHFVAGLRRIRNRLAPLLRRLRARDA